MRSIVRPRVLAGLFLGLTILYALIGFFLVPYIIQAYVIPSAEDLLKRPIVVREVSLNPFTLALDLKGLEVREPDHTPILGFEELLVNLHAATLLLQSVSFDEIHLVMPFVAAKVNREGELNLLGLIPPAGAPAADQPVPPAAEPKKRRALYIESLNIDQGIVEYRDESKPDAVTMDVVPISISLRDFSTVEGTENAYAFRAEIGKEEILAWEGSVSLDPVESDGRVSLTGLHVHTVYQAVQDRFRFDVLDGVLALDGTYHFDLKGGTPHVTVDNGNVSLQRLVLAERGLATPVVEIPAFEVDAIGFDLAGRSVSIGKVHSSDARLSAWIEPDGVMNYQAMFTPAGNKPAGQPQAVPPAAKETDAQSWSVAVHEIELHNYHALFEDRTLARPSHLEVEGLDLTLKGVGMPFKKAFPVDLSLTFNGSGLIGVRGQVAMEPMAADLDLMLKHVGLRAFQPYLDQYVNADVRDGALDLSGSLHYAEVHSQGPLLRFQGAVAINDLSITDRNEFAEVVTWKSLALNRLALDVEPTVVKLAEVVWQEPAAHLVVQPDGTLNLSGLMAARPQPDTPDQTAAATPKPAAPVPVAIHTVKLVKAAATFRDLSIQPPVKTGISELSGTIRGLSSKEIAKADVTLAGKVGAGAPLKVTGQINPLTRDAFTDLVVLFENIDLTTASPYAGKYAGYPIANGKLFLDLKYKIAKKELIGENKVLIDQLTFGDKTGSPDATSLPVPLAVALLKDRKGQIDVDLPVRGDLNDPDFKYGRVVLNALLNLLAKAATSPLSLLGSLAGGSEDELQFVEFSPGQSQVSEGATKKVAALETVLTERPGLYLEITGTADPRQDRPALAEEIFKARLAQMRPEGRAATAGAEPLSPEDEAKLVNQWYAAQFTPRPDQAGIELPVSEKRSRLVAAIPVEDSQFRQLAQKRAADIRSRLLASGAVAEERLVLRDVEIKEGSGESIPTRLGLAGRS
jgi:hypothetical protein